MVNISNGEAFQEVYQQVSAASRMGPCSLLAILDAALTKLSAILDAGLCEVIGDS